MAKKDQLNGMPFTCSNRRYQTNITKGKSHGSGNAKGSVFKDALVVAQNDYTLWLEHVWDKTDKKETFWLMWYDPAGTPTIPLSAEISSEQVKKMASQLAEFIKL